MSCAYLLPPTNPSGLDRISDRRSSTAASLWVGEMRRFLWMQWWSDRPGRNCRIFRLRLIDTSIWSHLTPIFPTVQLLVILLRGFARRTVGGDTDVICNTRTSGDGLIYPGL